MIHLIQNGIGFEQKVQSAFPDNPVSSGVTYIATVQTAPGYIHHHGIQRLSMGLFKPDQKHEGKLNYLIETGRQAGLNIFGPIAQIQQIRFHKLLWNGTILFKPQHLLTQFPFLLGIVIRNSYWTTNTQKSLSGML